jgi:glycosyltransferase involved in cell wall biosynthesis
MAAGLPIVGMQSALGDLVEDGTEGFLAAKPDRVHLERVIDRLLERKTVHIAMSEAARRRAREYSPRRLFSSYRDLINKLCGETTAG